MDVWIINKMLCTMCIKYHHHVCIIYFAHSFFSLFFFIVVVLFISSFFFHSFSSFFACCFLLGLTACIHMSVYTFGWMNIKYFSSWKLCNKFSSIQPNIYITAMHKYYEEKKRILHSTYTGLHPYTNTMYMCICISIY